ncbi:MAG: ATP-dependent helicase [Treponema sp.]|jgi:DNA helicase-2/ATP-dependent DNA helicase PcrA|nr:ATP-dependent helicase [Treponema sp.]
MAHDAMPPYLEILNPEQRKAVLHSGKPLLILAGAGSGKTRVITTKIAYLIREQGVDPRSILAVTFTNKAAREMAGRARLIDERAEAAMLRTFHSFGAWFLRRNGGLAGLNPGFVIYDDDDTASLLAAIMEGSPKAEVKSMARNIGRAKDFFLSPEDPELNLIDHRKIFRRIYSEYEEKLARIGNVDFGDLIKKPVEILRQNPAAAQRIRGRFSVILVDEYQDANIAQFELLKELCDPGNTYVCVVGDDDQSIYRFRGAEVRNILEFPDRFPGTEIIRLERNYRSTAQILQAASSVVGRNQNRLGKALRSERGSGKTPLLAFLPNQDEEAKYCADLIAKSVKAKNAGGNTARYSDWAVLYRTNAQSLEFETEFLHRRIPYRVVGSLKFYEREEIKDVLALLAFLVNPKDEVAWRRVVNKPARGLGSAALERVIERAASRDGDLAAALQSIGPELSAKARSGAAEFLQVIEEGRGAIAEKPDDGDVSLGDAKEKKKSGGPAFKKKPSQKDSLHAGEGLSLCVKKMAEESGIAEYHLSHDEIAGNQRLHNLQELANAASIYPASMEGLLEFLEHIELDRSMEEKSEAGDDLVTLITIHNTKGLEFRRVIITGVEQGVFPRDDKNGEDLEEERRLFYVGTTRAMDELYLCSCNQRRMYGSTAFMYPSVFLGEIDREALNITGSVPYSFQTLRGNTGRVHQAGNKKNIRSSDGRWQIGDRVFHDDHGYGGICAIKESGEGPVITVRFDTGGETRFLSEYQSGGYTKTDD